MAAYIAIVKTSIIGLRSANLQIRIRPMLRRTKGAGSLRLRGRVWWITYYVEGRPTDESTGTGGKDQADRLLKQRIGEAAAGRDVTLDKATIADLCGLVLADYRLRKLRDLSTVQWRYQAHVKPILGNLLAARFGARQAREYMEQRR